MAFDVVIIGSGPAASATAIHCVRHGLEAALLIRPALRGRFEIPQTLPPLITYQLAALNFSEQFQRLGFRRHYSTSSVWGADSVAVRHSICHPSGPGWLVDRPRLDAALLQHAINEGASAIECTSFCYEGLNGHWLVHAQQVGKSGSLLLETSTVVDASGRLAAFARQLGVRRFGFDRLVCQSAQALNRDDGSLGDVLVESEPEGWWFTAPNERGDLAVARFTDADLRPRAERSVVDFERHLRMAPHTWARVGRLLPGTFRATAATTDRLEVCAGERWCAVGDAVLACDPLGSRGVITALESAEVAAELIASRGMTAETSAEYSHYQAESLQRFRSEQQYFYGIERRWLKAKFWQRRSSNLLNAVRPRTRSTVTV
jgi:flavin-dependent dehydrogenase